MKKFIALLLMAIITAGLTFVLVSGNFFMFNLIIQNKTKATQEINEAVAGYAYARYYDLTVVEETTNGEDKTINEVSIKLSYNEDFHFDFAGHQKLTEILGGVEEVKEIDFYYVDGYLYTKENDEKLKADMSFNNAIDEIFTYGEIVVLEAMDYAEEFLSEDVTFSTQFIFSFKPLYVGLGYGMHSTDALPTEFDIVFKLDMQKHFRGINYDMTFGPAHMNIKTDVLSYNKELTLTLPSDLSSYVAI